MHCQMKNIARLVFLKDQVTKYISPSLSDIGWRNPPFQTVKKERKRKKKYLNKNKAGKFGLWLSQGCVLREKSGPSKAGGGGGGAVASSRFNRAYPPNVAI